MARTPEAVDRLYQALVDQEDARVCKEISDEACHELPGNFFKMTAAQTLTSLGDELANAKTVLPWLMTWLGAPAAWISWLVPIRESGSLLPQLVIAAWVRQHERRKHLWTAGSVVQGVSLAAMAGAAMTLRGEAAGLAVIGLLIVFSLARGLCSVAHKDVLGKTVPKTRRGRLTGIAGAVSGVLTLAVGAAVGALSPGDGEQAAMAFLALLLGGSMLWVVAAIVFAMVREDGGETGGGGNALTEAVKKLDLLRTDAPFRRFTASRALLLSSPLMAPWLVALSRAEGDDGAGTLGLFVFASGLAASLSGTVWGRFADLSSKRTLILAALASSAIGVAVWGLTAGGVAAGWGMALYPLAFFVLAIAHSGIRVGRKTYVVDMASGNRRTDYVAVGNTVIGVALLVVGAVTALPLGLAPEQMILALSVMGLAGVALALGLPEVE